MQSFVLADTLRFAISISNIDIYTEAATVGTKVAGRSETITRFVLGSPSLMWTRASSTTITVPQFLGGSAQGTLAPQIGGFSRLTLLTPANQGWLCVPGP